MYSEMLIIFEAQKGQEEKFMKRVFFNVMVAALMFFVFVVPFTAITAEATTVEEEQTCVGETTESVETTETAETAEKESDVPEWNGEVLNASMGVLEVGPNGGCEMWHNLDMTQCIKNLKEMGIDMCHWTRDDGVQMYGPYVMCAASLETYEMGDIVVTSLGEAIVCDTGDYAKIDPLWVNIATVWKSC